ncbi:MAG: hypothetical protein HY824_13125 [Acidobacteria bacterium]|nr:hypothetical protein [Acidobacteriota bacterium]
MPGLRTRTGTTYQRRRDGTSLAIRERGTLVTMSRTRRFCGDALISMSVLTLVLGVLVSVDERVRDRVWLAAAGAASSDSAGLAAPLRAAASTVVDAARAQSVDHAPLMVFVLVATVLLLALVRT